MRIERNEKNKVLYPESGMWLYNEKDDIVSDSVIMPLSANEESWVEISEEERISIMMSMENNNNEPDE